MTNETTMVRNGLGDINHALDGGGDGGGGDEIKNATLRAATPALDCYFQYQLPPIALQIDGLKWGIGGRC